eukprot:CAMPEP_0113888668 /NCGR_PEP_ID=MMETSP0780_2-20120614/13002_1 /TAXON_ID=652834 /ORGANISM="Palpitomonas bilix" /LENGTH=214 /DNA_ID=CAMNT_0000877547 /DNA_START=77 /DNA_END=723 /DNA_ORIENTATION=- /assembly_acc=CAM_ASM_000599
MSVMGGGGEEKIGEDRRGEYNRGEERRGEEKIGEDRRGEYNRGEGEKGRREEKRREEKRGGRGKRVRGRDSQRECITHTVTGHTTCTLLEGRGHKREHRYTLNDIDGVVARYRPEENLGQLVRIRHNAEDADGQYEAEVEEEGEKRKFELLQHSAKKAELHVLGAHKVDVQHHREDERGCYLQARYEEDLGQLALYRLGNVVDANIDEKGNDGE